MFELSVDEPIGAPLALLPGNERCTAVLELTDDSAVTPETVRVMRDKREFT
ncbi:hypothetical protein [Jidongwangia harbinensis]|uniref:hypothetical protein n=1 Tax=Jidongwangia harbinensis TaxID=2878561 RepID=UPI001CD9F0D3|nr:hypothetical protein [Jidongwangia harbinensis]MCA2211736.1 hypothetical protein [Jidongwangia harbinensis]